MWNLKYVNGLIYKTNSDVEKKLMVTKGDGGEGEINREVEVDAYVLPYMDS